jgi:hypothetical protein
MGGKSTKIDPQTATESSSTKKIYLIEDSLKIKISASLEVYLLKDFAEMLSP